MARRGGNSDDEFCATGLEWRGLDNDPSGFKSDGSGSSPKDSWGPEDFCYADHLDSKANRRKDRESKYNSEKTAIDTPSWPSDARVKKLSAQHYNSDPYSAGPNRKG